MEKGFQVLSLKKIKPNRLNPRLEFSKRELDELADSIKEKGILQPIITRPRNSYFEVVVGERRYRAAQQAGLDEVPVIIRDYSDDEVIELNLVENIQRADLSAVEKAKSCQALRDKYPQKYPVWQKVADVIGVDVDTIKSWVRTLDLPEEIQTRIAPREIQRIPQGKVDYQTALHVVEKIKDKPRQLEVIKKLAERRLPQRLAKDVIKQVSLSPQKDVEQIVKRVVEAPPQLPFRFMHVMPILKKKKIQTSRSGIDPKIRVGAIVRAAIFEPSFADLKISKISRKRLGEFTEEDAEREGGYTLKEFKQAWEYIHGKGSWNSEQYVDIIEFQLQKINPDFESAWGSKK